MKRKQQHIAKLTLKKATITPLNAEAANVINGGAITIAGGCVQPTTTVQHTFVCPTFRICPTTYTFHCTTE